MKTFSGSLHTVLLLFLFVAGLDMKSAAQRTELTDFVLQYRTYAQTTDASSNVKENMGYQTMVVGENKMKVVSQLRKGVMGSIVFNQQGRNSISYYTNGKEYLSGVESGFRSNIFNIVPPFQKVTGTQLTNEEKLINGRLCKKAVMIYGDNARMAEVWYDEMVLLRPVSFSNDLSSIPGLPVVIAYTALPPMGLSGGQPIRTVMKLDSCYQPANINEALQVEDMAKYPPPAHEYGQIFNKLMSMQAQAPPVNFPADDLKQYLVSTRTEQLNGHELNGISVRMKEPVNPFKVGEKITSFKVSAMSGASVNSKKLKHNATVINFWFTSCSPCITEMPMLNELVDEYRQKDVSFLAFTYESQKEVADFLRKRPFNYDHVANIQKYIDEIGVRSYPVTVILDKQGVIRYSSVSRIPLKEQLKKVIDELLG